MLKKSRIKNVIPTTYKGISFRSTLESKVANILDNLGIGYLYESKKFIIQEPFEYKGNKYRGVSYLPDFIIEDIILECKGFSTPEWKLKKKMFLNYLNNNNLNYRFYEVHNLQELYDMIDENMDMFENIIGVYDLKGNLVGRYNTVKEAVSRLNLKNSYNIQGCLAGFRKKAQGLIWKWEKAPFVYLEGEIWKPVKNMETLYKVSNYGRVISIQFHGKTGCKLMTQTTVKLGYKFVKLRDWKNGIANSFPVHRLVAEAFIPNPENKPQVDHIDTNPSNNNLDNLRWVTNLENQRNPLTLSKISSHMTSMNKESIGPKASAAKKRKAVVYQGITYKSIIEASRETGYSASSIKKWCDNNQKNWSYEESIRNNEESNKGSS